MADAEVDELEEGEPESDEIKEVSLDELVEDEDDLVDDDALVVDEIALDADVVADEPEADPTEEPRPAGEDEEEDELEEEHDVEASLDEILKERLVVVEEEEDEETPVDTDERTETGKVLPKQPDEFVCQSCFLVKHPSQLADAKKQRCRDCV